MLKKNTPKFQRVKIVKYNDTLETVIKYKETSNGSFAFVRAFFIKMKSSEFLFSTFERNFYSITAFEESQ